MTSDKITFTSKELVDILRNTWNDFDTLMNDARTIYKEEEYELMDGEALFVSAFQEGANWLYNKALSNFAKIREEKRGQLPDKVTAYEAKNYLRTCFDE